MVAPKNAAKRRGAATVETAIVIGMLLLLIIGGMDFAFQFYVRYLMTTAGRDAARCLSVRGGTQDQATTAAKNDLQSINAAFTVTFPPPANPQDITVQISVPRAQVSLGLFPGPTGAKLITNITMRKEQ